MAQYELKKNQSVMKCIKDKSNKSPKWNYICFLILFQLTSFSKLEHVTLLLLYYVTVDSHPPSWKNLVNWNDKYMLMTLPEKLQFIFIACRSNSSFAGIYRTGIRRKNLRIWTCTWIWQIIMAKWKVQVRIGFSKCKLC